MADRELAIIIEGWHGDWPGGPRILMARPPSREPNGRTCWFGAELDPDGDQVWFRIDDEAIGRMPEKTPAARGDRLIDALIVWLTPAPAAPAQATPLGAPRRPHRKVDAERLDILR